MDAATRESSAPEARPATLGLIFLTIFLDLIGFSIIFPLFPHMLAHYFAREGDAGLLGAVLDLIRNAAGDGDSMHHAVLFGGILGSLYSLLQFLFAPFWGGLSDRTGRRPVLLVTVAGLAASYFLWFWSGSFLLLVVSRLFGGMMAGNISVATAAVADSTPPEKRAQGMGIIGAAFGLGFILGPPLGAALSAVDLTRAAPSLERVGVNPFSAAAAGAFLLSAVNWIVLWKWFPETLRPEDRGKAREGGRTINISRLFHPVDIPGVHRTNLTWFLYLLSFSGMEFTLTFLAVERFGFTQMQNGYMFVFIGLIIAFVQGGLIRQLAPLYGEKSLAVAGFLTVTPGLLLTGFCRTQGMLYLGLALMAFGSALVTPSLSALLSLYTPSSRQGSVLGVFRSLGALARAVGPLSAALAYWRFGAKAAYAVGTAILVAPFLMVLTLPQPPRREVSPSRGPPPS